MGWMRLLNHMSRKNECSEKHERGFSKADYIKVCQKKPLKDSV